MFGGVLLRGTRVAFTGSKGVNVEDEWNIEHPKNELGRCWSFVKIERILSPSGCFELYVVPKISNRVRPPLLLRYQAPQGRRGKRGRTTAPLQNAPR